MNGLTKHQNERSWAQQNFTLLLGLFFLSALLFLFLADFPVNNSAGVDRIVSDINKTFSATSNNNEIDVAGVGWTGIISDWWNNLFGGTPVAGVGWTGIISDWWNNLFGGTQPV